MTGPTPAFALAIALSLALAACGSSPDDAGSQDDSAMGQFMAEQGVIDGPIAAVSPANGDFATLAAAIRSAGLEDTLSDDGPYTLFAPSDAAFAKLPQATRERLLGEAGREELADILTYHLVDGKTGEIALATEVENAGGAGYRLTTVEGGTLTAGFEGSDLVLRDAKGNRAVVTATDIGATNGVVHTVDTVLMPR